MKGKEECRVAHLVNLSFGAQILAVQLNNERLLEIIVAVRNEKRFIGIVRIMMLLPILHFNSPIKDG